MSSPWDPKQYEKFRAERSRPFHDLAALLELRPGMRLLDLGCGTGELTRSLFDRLDSSTILGIDRSETMLSEAQSRACDGLQFVQCATG